MYRRLKTVMVREVAEDLLLLDLERQKIHQLNQVASFIWRNCDEAGAPEEIAARLAIEFEVEEHTAHKDVIETLGKLRSLNLIVDV